MKMNLPTLYKKDRKENIRVWKIWTSNNCICVQHGQQFGTMQLSAKYVEGKNIGKKNQTTPQEQAALDATSMWKKQKDKGYVEDLNKVDEIVYLPMLANDFEKRKGKIEYPVHLQPKLDGMRALAMWDGDRVVLLSRKGKEYNVLHIAQELESIIQPNMILDGEIYTHGYNFQEITRLVKKYREGETEHLQYWIYDVFMIGEEATEWFDRHKMLTNVILSDNNIIKTTKTLTAYNEREIYKLQKEFVRRGYEGAIVRELRAPYEINKRSNHLLKVKEFKDNEYKIIGYKEGEGKFVGCVIWKCITEEGKDFDVVPKGTLKQKKQWFKDGDKYVGSWLKVKYFELSEENKPRFPVGLGIRLPEDM